MAIGRVEGEQYPYLPVEVRIGDWVDRFQVLVDTGFDGDIAIPGATDVGQSPDGMRRWNAANESRVEALIYAGIARVGDFEFVPVTVAAVGREAILGRRVTDRYRLVFDHGERVILEP